MAVAGYDVDKGWAWLVLIAIYSGILFLSTSLYTAGVIFVALLDYYHEDAAKTSIIGALNSGFLCLMGPLASVVMNTYSCRTSMLIGSFLLTMAYVVSAFVDSIDLLIVFLGVIGGIGNSLISSPFVVVIAYYFEKRRDFLIGMSTVVIGVAMNAASPLALYLLETYGLKGTFVLTGGICAQLLVCSVICKPSSTELQVKKNKTSKPYKTDESDERETFTRNLSLSKWSRVINLELLANVPFLAFLLSTMTWNFMLSVCLMHLPNYIVTKGLETSKISLIMTVFSITNTAGRFLGALAVNQNKVHSITIHMLALFCGGILTLSFPLYSHMSMAAYIFAGLAGLFTGVPNSLMTAISVNLIGVDRISSAHGLEYFFSGVGYVTGPPIAGLLYERTQSYENSFVLSAAVLLSGSIISVFTCISIRKNRKQKQKLAEKPAMEELSMMNSDA